MKASAVSILLASLVLAVPACGTMRARTDQAAARLEIPPPPPRAIVAVPPEPAPLASVDVPPEQTPGLTPLPTPPPTPIAPPPPSPAPRNVREQPPPPRPPAPQENPPAQQLQTTANVGEAEQRVRSAIAQASRDLNRIDYKLLNAEARSQYDIAKRFVQQAGEALAAKNFVFAGQLADKAATLAGLLTSR